MTDECVLQVFSELAKLGEYMLVKVDLHCTAPTLCYADLSFTSNIVCQFDRR